jgi:hypothetical protein
MVIAMKFWIGVLTLVAVLGLATAARAQGTGTVTGKVENEDGKAFAGVKVMALNRASGQTTEVVTGGEGKYSLELEAGDYTVSFEAEGYASATLQRAVTVTATKATEVRTIRMEKEAAYSVILGRVFNEDGFSVPGATVVLEQIGEGGKKLKLTKESSSAGSFAFRLPGEPGRYRVTATLKGFKPDSKEVEVDKGERRTIALKLAR